MQDLLHGNGVNLGFLIGLSEAKGTGKGWKLGETCWDIIECWA
jgi:hypothetical protein